MRKIKRKNIIVTSIFIVDCVCLVLMLLLFVVNFSFPGFFALPDKKYTFSSVCFVWIVILLYVQLPLTALSKCEYTSVQCLCNFCAKTVQLCDIQNCEIKSTNRFSAFSAKWELSFTVRYLKRIISIENGVCKG